MGQAYTFLAAEKKTWLEHSLQYDNDCRQSNLEFLALLKNGDILKLCYVDSEWGSVKFQHWFVSNGKIELEFGGQNLDIYSARVKFNTTARLRYIEDRVFRMDDAIRQRIEHVLGLRNYSLCLRNCEHVANYVLRGQWVSSQMNEDGKLMYWFRDYFMSNTKAMVNSFPSQIRAHVFDQAKTPIYTKQFLERNHLGAPFTATGFQYYLDSVEDTYNILVIGPTGAGKSHLINVFFNQEICQTQVVNLHSTTKEIYFIRGHGKSWNIEKNKYETRQIVVADTVGLCDTDWDDDQVINLIKGRVSSNIRFIDAVFIVFNARNRMEKQHVANIRKVMEWLKYDSGDNWMKFWFVGTHGEMLNEVDISTVVNQATENLHISKHKLRLRATGEEIKSTFVTGFPKQDQIHTRGQEDDVGKSWQLLRQHVENPGIASRLGAHRVRIDLSAGKCLIL